jgi:hypothetical protein
MKKLGIKDADKYSEIILPEGFLSKASDICHAYIKVVSKAIDAREFPRSLTTEVHQHINSCSSL